LEGHSCRLQQGCSANARRTHAFQPGKKRSKGTLLTTHFAQKRRLCTSLSTSRLQSNLKLTINATWQVTPERTMQKILTTENVCLRFSLISGICNWPLFRDNVSNIYLGLVSTKPDHMHARLLLVSITLSTKTM
jgi:hypothetical protein